MTTPDENTLRNALAAHNEGRLTEAEVGYRRVLRKRPNDPTALYGLGLLDYHRGALNTAVQYVSRSLEVAPANGRAWNTLGSMYMSTGREREAKEAYDRAIKAAPTMSEAWYNLSICQGHDGDIDGAVGSLYAAAACDPRHPQVYDALASLLYREGRESEAAEVYREWSAKEPENAKARHMSAASSGDEAPERASDEYVREHFDASASSFDTNLRQLKYRSHEVVAAALAERAAAPDRLSAASRMFSVVLDAGCGTGLCGPLVRPLCQRLVGVDLSPKMLDVARTRACYDELVVAELSAFMRSRSSTFDAIICADTLVYFGALDEPLSAAREALSKNGSFVFTVEGTVTAGPTGVTAGAIVLVAEAADYHLGVTGRYTHNESYLRRAVAAAGLELEVLSRTTLRQERDQNVTGFLVVSQRL